MKEYREQNQEKNKQYGKEYRKINHENIKRYYRQNKEKIKHQQTQPYSCVCGACIQIGEKARHERSLKHQNFLKQQM